MAKKLSDKEIEGLWLAIEAMESAHKVLTLTPGMSEEAARLRKVIDDCAEAGITDETLRQARKDLADAGRRSS